MNTYKALAEKAVKAAGELPNCQFGIPDFPLCVSTTESGRYEIHTVGEYDTPTAAADALAAAWQAIAARMIANGDMPLMSLSPEQQAEARRIDAGHDYVHRVFVGENGSLLSVQNTLRPLTEVIEATRGLKAVMFYDF